LKRKRIDEKKLWKRLNLSPFENLSIIIPQKKRKIQAFFLNILNMQKPAED